MRLFFFLWVWAGGEWAVSMTLSGAAGDFVTSLLTYVPATTTGLLLLLCTVQYLRLNATKATGLDSSIFTLSVMTLSRTMIYEILANKDVNESNAEVWAFLGSLAISVVLTILLCFMKRVAAFMLFVVAAFLVFIVLYSKPVWPLWISLTLLGLGALYVLWRKKIHAMAFVIGVSLWYTLHIVYGVSFFISKDWTAFHDLAHDSQLGLTCWSQRGCLIRTTLLLIGWIVRIALCAFCQCCLGDRKENADLAKLKAQLEDIEDEKTTAAAAAQDDSGNEQ